MQHFKMSTSRDFRINAASLQAAMDEATAADEASDESDAVAVSDTDQVIDQLGNVVQYNAVFV